MDDFVKINEIASVANEYGREQMRATGRSLTAEREGGGFRVEINGNSILLTGIQARQLGALLSQ